MDLEIPTEMRRLAAAINKIGYKIVFKNGLPHFCIADMEFMVITPPDENKYGVEEEYCLELECGNYGLDYPDYDELFEIYDIINDIHMAHLGGVIINIDTAPELCFVISYSHISFVKETPMQMQKTLDTMTNIMLQTKYDLEKSIDRYKRHRKKK